MPEPRILVSTEENVLILVRYRSRAFLPVLGGKIQST